MSYASKDIRNIALLGHGGNGKTSLAESILFLTGVTDRLGSTAAGNSVSDYDQEEIRRQISISASTMYTEYQKTKINIIDTPGYFDFAGEVAQALRVADIGIICVSAKDGLNVGAEKAWKALTDAGVPRAIYISKVDEEHADFYKAFEQLREKFGPSLSPMSAPIMDGTKVAGLVDILARKAYKYEGKKRTEIPMPADMSGRVEELYSEIAENAAGTSEELMDKYLETMELSAEEIYGALGTGIAECEITPVFCGSAVTGLGTIVLLDAIKNFFPYPREGGKRVDENAPTKAIVYKTISDQFGKFSLFKVIAGKVTPDMTLVNARSGAQEKLGHIYYMQGKKNIEVQEIGCGDIGAVSKLSDTKTGDTLCDSKAVEAAPGIEYAVPCYSMAIAPKTKGQEDKVAQGLARLGEEDRSFTITNNAETKQMVIAGAGDDHLLGLRVVGDGEGAVLLAEPREALGDLVLLALRLGGDGHGVAGDGVLDAGRGLNGLAVAEGVAGLGVGELAHGADVAAADLLDLDVLLALHVVDVAELLLRAGAGVHQGHVRRDLAGDDLEEGELAELVGDGLVDYGLGRGVLVHALAALARVGEEVLDGVEQHDGAEAGDGAAAEDGGDLALGDAGAERAVDLLGGELHGLEVLVHQLLAGAGGVLGDLAVKLLNAAGHVGGHGDLGALLALVLVGLAGEDVHQAGDLGAVHDGGGHGAQRGAEFLAQLLKGLVEVGVLLVHLGDVYGTGHTRVGKGLPGLFGADVQAVLRGDADDADVRDAQGLGDLAGEVEVSRGVDDVDLGLLILGVHGAGGDADLAAYLLLVVVRDGVARGGAAEPVGNAGQKEDALGEAGLAVAAVSEQRDVADVLGCIAHV